MAEKGICNESVINALAYAFMVDPYSPTFLSKGDMIFNLNEDEDIAVSTNDTIELRLQYSDSNFTAAHWAARNMKVSAQYMAFSGAASMAVETTGNSKYHTVRVDAIGKCTKVHITSRGAFRTHPVKFMTEDFKKSIVDLSVQDIESKIGVFYGIKVGLGGMVKRSYVLEAMEDDDEAKVTAELQAAFGKECLGTGPITANASFKAGRRSSNRKARIRKEWHAQGGQTDLWFKLGSAAPEESEFTSAMEIANEWACTIESSNYYAFGYELRPLWDLIEEIDKAKAVEFRQYLEEKWQKDVSQQFLPSMFLPVKLRICQIPDASKAFILNTCREHKTVLMEEIAEAQGNIDSVLQYFDRHCYRRWKAAALFGIETVEEIQEIVNQESVMSVEEVLTKLEKMTLEIHTESKRYLGLWGKDSKESNRVQLLNRSFVNKVDKRLKIDLNRQDALHDGHDDLNECQQEVDEAIEWFKNNLECMSSKDKVRNVNRAIDRVKDIQTSLNEFLNKLEAEIKE